MRTSDKMIKSAVEALEETMREVGTLPAEYSLRVQIGSAYYGNSNWVAITGGYLGSAVDPIDALHIPSNRTKQQFIEVIKAYHSALYAVKKQAASYGIQNNS